MARYKGGSSASVALPNCLEFSGAVNCHVNHGFFWGDNISLGNQMLWEAWVRYLGSGYLISDGYGGSHAILMGPAGGNIWNGANAISYGSGDDPPPSNAWVHHQVSMATDRNASPWIYVWFNGVCVGRYAMTGTRQTTTGGNGGRVMFVGGSDHINGNLRLAQIRGFDKVNPYGNAGHGCEIFYPQRTFNAEVAQIPADFLADYTKPGLIIPDLSDGYGGGDDAEPRVLHPGRLGSYATQNSPAESGSGPRPVFVNDPLAPFDANGSIVYVTRGLTPASVPGGARVFDSFSRDDSIPAWTTGPTLGSTEGGSRGPLVWQYFNQQVQRWDSGWGVWNGRAVRLSGWPGAAWVDNGAADMDVRVTRRKGTAGTGETGVALRAGANGNYIYVVRMTDPSTLNYGVMTNGVMAGVENIAPPNDTWTKLRVTFVGNSMTICVDDGNDGWTTVATRTETNHAANTGAGIAWHGPELSGGRKGFSALARWDDFTVL